MKVESDKNFIDAMKLLDTIRKACPPIPGSRERMKEMLEHEGPIVVVSPEQFKKIKEAEHKRLGGE